MKTKYNEGSKTKEKFERTMTTLFRVPRSVVAEKIKAKKKKGKGRVAKRYRDEFPVTGIEAQK